MNKYVLLKVIDTDSIEIGEVFTADKVCRLNDGSTIPLWRLIGQGYIKPLHPHLYLDKSNNEIPKT